MSKLRSLVAASFLSFLSSAVAGGSFATERVFPLLKQNAELFSFITQTLDLESGGTATRVGTRVSPGLGGARIAPYVIRVKPKDSKGSWQFYLIINAETTSLDQEGRDVPLEQGKSIKERLVGIELVPIVARGEFVDGH